MAYMTQQLMKQIFIVCNRVGLIAQPPFISVTIPDRHPCNRVSYTKEKYCKSV